jgi:hypothetical protein
MGLIGENVSELEQNFEEMPPEVQTKYLHVLSVVAQMLSTNNIDLTLITRCQSEWPEAFHHYIKRN